MFHGNLAGNIFKVFSEPKRNKIRRIKGGDKVPHELFITVPVTFKQRVWKMNTVFC